MVKKLLSLKQVIDFTYFDLICSVGFSKLGQECQDAKANNQRTKTVDIASKVILIL